MFGYMIKEQAYQLPKNNVMLYKTIPLLLMLVLMGCSKTVNLNPVSTISNNVIKNIGYKIYEQKK